MYRARDQLENEAWLAELDAAAERLDLGARPRSIATDLFLADVPEKNRSKRAALAASLYAGALIAGEERPQTRVADAMGVSRLTVQQHWRDRIEQAGLEAPNW